MKKSGLRDTPELPLEHNNKRLCARCGRNEVYQDTKTMDWCEPCIAQLVEAPESETENFRRELCAVPGDAAPCVPKKALMGRRTHFTTPTTERKTNDRTSRAKNALRQSPSPERNSTPTDSLPRTMYNIARRGNQRRLFRFRLPSIWAGGGAARPRRKSRPRDCDSTHAITGLAGMKKAFGFEGADSDGIPRSFKCGRAHLST